MSSDDPSDPSYVSPAFGRKLAPSYYQKTKLNLSLLDSDPESPSMSDPKPLSPEEQDLITAQSEAAKQRFIKDISPTISKLSNPSITPTPISYEEALEIYKMERNGLVGRPRLLTPEHVAIITDNIRLGTPRSIAAGLAGIEPNSLNAWVSRGQKHISEGTDSEFSRLVFEILIAEKELKSRLANRWVKLITEPTVRRVYKEQVVQNKDGSYSTVRYLDKEEHTGDGDWKGIMAYLERTSPEEFKRVERVEQTGPNGGPIQVQQATIDVGKLTPEERRVLFGIVKREVDKGVEKGLSSAAGSGDEDSEEQALSLTPLEPEGEEG